MRITAHAYEQAMAHCAASLPYEGCGAFLGQRDGIASFQPLRNRSPRPLVSFMLDPEEWIPLLYMPDKQVIGLLHSHPVSAAVPSEADHQLYWPDLPSYWIASFQHRHSPELSCYRIRRSSAQSGEASIQFQRISYTMDT